jgi:hypothetical protein
VDLKWSYLSADRRAETSKPEDGEFSVEMLREEDERIKVLLRQNVELSIDDEIRPPSTSDRPPSPSDRLGSINGEVPFPPETTQVRILRGDVELISIRVSDEAPTIDLTSTKITPKREQLISWKAEGEGPIPLWYVVFIELDNGVRYPLTPAFRESELKVDFERLPGCKQGRIAVRASAGFRTAEAATETFSLPVKPPRPRIGYPKEGGELPLNQPLQLRGQGIDYQTLEPVPPNNLEWFIDDSFVGKGRLCVVPPLSRGKHAITLRVTDESGEVGERKIEVTAVRHLKPRAEGPPEKTLPEQKKRKRPCRKRGFDS